ncbi:MAG: ABC transporter permease [Gemmatimonadota bacterium]
MSRSILFSRTLQSPVFAAAVAAALGLAVLAIGLAAAGYDPASALGALWRGAFGSWYAFTSATLVRATPLIVLGIGFALAMQAGALNIGAEGQFYAGAIAATWVALHVGGVPGVVAIPAVLAAGAVAGALWILGPVVLRLRFGVLEVISTLLLNFVAEALVSLMVQGPLQEAKHIYPQSDPIPTSARLPLMPGTRLHVGLLLAVGLGAAAWVVLRRTRWGFALRAAGAGPRAAQVIGRIRVPRTLATGLLISGSLAGLGGAIEITGVTYALFQNLSPGYGFQAIAVALLARLNPLGVVAAGLLFGALEAGAGGMQREAGVPAVAVDVVQAVVIVVTLLSVAASSARAAAAAPEAT